MVTANAPLDKDKIEKIRRTYGDYVKVTGDVEKRIVVIGSELHADGEEILLEKGSRQDDIWGGGIHLVQKAVDATAVLNLRPSRGNPSMEILNSTIREKFLDLIKHIFQKLWKR